MINAKELRIGNLVDFNGQVETVYALRNSGIDFYRGKTKKSVIMQSYLWEAIKPIKLTEEWLLKFWFKKEIDKLSITIYDNICINFFCYEHDDDFITLTNLNLEGNNVIHNELKNIKYVHQLQNLYFALTGSELSIS